jgi:hypothetical protein
VWGSSAGGGATGGEMNQALYAHMNNKRKMKKKINFILGEKMLKCHLNSQVVSLPYIPERFSIFSH